MEHASCDSADGILLLDDLALRRAGMTMLLTPWAASEGLTILPADLDFVQSATRRDFRLVLLVSSHPGSTSSVINVIDRVKSAFPATPLAILSDTDHADDIRAACSLGVQGYISTRLEPSVALKALSFVLAGGQCFPPKPLLHDGCEPERVATNGECCSHLRLTLRQQEILEGLQKGYSNKVIARHLNITEATVKLHVRHIMRKLGVHNRTQVALTTFARAEGA